MFKSLYYAALLVKTKIVISLPSEHLKIYCAAFLSNRKYLGVDISEEYIHIAKTRLLKAKKEMPTKWLFCPDEKITADNLEV
jgi:hypothetical protein